MEYKEVDIGDKINKWTVIDRKRMQTRYPFKYKLQCVCGTIKEKLVNTYYLKHVNGCFKCATRVGTKAIYNIIVGKKYKGWTVTAKDKHGFINGICENGHHRVQLGMGALVEKAMDAPECRMCTHRDTIMQRDILPKHYYYKRLCIDIKRGDERWKNVLPTVQANWIQQ